MWRNNPAVASTARTLRLPVFGVLSLVASCAGCGHDLHDHSSPSVTGADAEGNARTDRPAGAEDEIRPSEEADVPAGTEHEQESSVKDEIETALAAAQSDGKRVLLDFGADWCPDCRVLERMFAEEPVLTVLQAGYHVVRIDVGRKDRNLDVVGQYDNPIAGGIPAVVILDGAGTVLVATNQGELATARSMPSEEVLAFVKRWAPGASDEPNGE